MLAAFWVELILDAVVAKSSVVLLRVITNHVVLAVDFAITVGEQGHIVALQQCFWFSDCVCVLRNH